ncbi:MAG: Glyoxylate reductase [Nitrosopumilales archaeon]|nr:MAG: Glyoxylate reductase [Nitrosopumilales archaeon]
MNNVVIAPHIGSSTSETRKKMAGLTVKNLELALSGKKSIYSV